MGLFLYGAAVQGIQGFIFETSKLKEIVGASELVEQVCTSLFKEFINEDKVKIILSAAGNIRLYAESRDNLMELVLKFPKAVQESASGITISQAVFESTGDEIAKSDFDRLEENLKIQRNIPVRPIGVTGCAIERFCRIGKSAVERDKDGSLLDMGTKKKVSSVTKIKTEEENANENKKSAHRRLTEKLLKGERFRVLNGKAVRFPFDMKYITSNDCRWLAVIHADGNNLGKHIQVLEGGEPPAKLYKDFSRKLENATCRAASNAFDTVIQNKIISEEIILNNNFFPLRPIVIGGDDISIICRADIAIEFTSTYLEAFEAETKEAFDGRKFTACAGISFVKESYPFHYAIHLAEELCSAAKSKSKKVNTDEVPASLAFHKVHSSFVDSYASIKDTVLCVKGSDDYPDLGFDFGPYSINEDVKDMTAISELLGKIKVITDLETEKRPSPVAGLRKWLSALYDNRGAADQLLTRLNQIHGESMGELNLIAPVNDNNKTIVYDLLSLLSLKGGE